LRYLGIHLAADTHTLDSGVLDDTRGYQGDTGCNDCFQRFPVLGRALACCCYELPLAQPQSFKEWSVLLTVAFRRLEHGWQVGLRLPAGLYF
jgi:hypothetical protein